jgi:RimJ/RimL family protein N-acetyltransferase
MQNIVLLQDARLLAWAAERLQAKFSPSACRWVAGLAVGGIVWVVVYSHFSTRNCVMSIATDATKRWASRHTFRTIFGIPFNEWNLDRVSFIVSEKNEASLRMLRHAGRFSICAAEEGRMRKAFDDNTDGILFGLLKADCQWR